MSIGTNLDAALYKTYMLMGILKMEYRKILVLACLLSLYSMLVFAYYSLPVLSNPQLFLAWNIDLIITIPLIYFFMIRHASIPKTTVVPLMIIGYLLGNYLLPDEHHQYLDIFKKVLFPIIEIGIMGFIIYKARKAWVAYDARQKKVIDRYAALKEVCDEMLPQKISALVSNEFAIIYYGFIKWGKSKAAPLKYKYHQNSGTMSLMIIFIFLLIVETIVVHLLLERWSVIAAWILTALSLYSVLQVFGTIKSMIYRPILLNKDHLILRYGILAESKIEIQNIASIEKSKKPIGNDSNSIKLSPLGDFESHNVIIELKEENSLIGIFGAVKKYKNIALYVDEPDRLIEDLEQTKKDEQYIDLLMNASIDKKHKTSKNKLYQSLNSIFWIFGISWAFAFWAFHKFDKSQEVAYGLSLLVFAMLPALTTLAINIKEGGNLSDLNFRKADLKSCIKAFVTPLVYLAIVFAVQYAISARALPNWSKLGSDNDIWLSIIAGYPIMFVLIMGEEIAWRGYLQDKLQNALGYLKGIFVLGIVWGLWHLPISIQGHNLPNHPMLETWLTTPLMCIALSFAIAYYNFNNRSIYIALLLHASNNHFAGIFMHVTDVHNELHHAMVFSFVYVMMIVVYGWLLWNKSKKLTLDQRPQKVGWTESGFDH